ncbi:MAG: HAD-IA family hydrolase [Candidatus Marinimicrobia bacterium]|nr:HAD-IA family hydrolase [Candidatus Neomarinimicrobiota bacterium]
MIRALIFDLDNTIIDFVRLKENAIDSGLASMAEAGLKFDKKEAHKRIMEIYEEKGWEYQEVFNDFILEINDGILDYKFLAAGIVGYRRAKEASLVPYPQVISTLFKLAKRGLKLGIVSDAPSREAWLRLCYLNLHNVFDEVVTLTDTGKLKPSPEPFREILSRLEVSADEALMIGDWPERDMVGAASVGMKSVFARYGDTFDTVKSGADYEIDDFNEILDIIDKENES